MEVAENLFMLKTTTLTYRQLVDFPLPDRVSRRRSAQSDPSKATDTYGRKWEFRFEDKDNDKPIDEQCHVLIDK